MIDPDHPRLSIVKQCELLSVTRSTYYYQPCGESDLNLELMRLIDKQYLETPFYGPRQMTRHLRREGHGVSRTRIGRLMKLMGLSAIYQKPRTSIPNVRHKVYPYLLRGLTIDRPNQVWCADITYIPMRKGFLYLVDNVMVERLWRSLKYECIYLNAFETGSEVRQGLNRWIDFYNSRRPHSSLDDRTPDEAYWQKPRPGYAGPTLKMAA